MISRLIAGALCTWFALLAPSAAHAWWNDDWQFRKEISFDLTSTGANVPDSVADVPVLLRLSIANFEFWGDAQPDGGDIRFVLGDDRTPVTHHIELWDSARQMALIWVRMPQLTGGANTDRLYMYYGNPEAPGGGDSAATYDRNQVLVYHFGEASGPPVDATAYGTNPAQSTIEAVPASLIGGGARVGPDRSLTIPATGALRLMPAAGLTLSSWLRIEAAQPDAVLASLRDERGELVLGLRGTRLHARLAAGGSPAVELTQSSGELVPGTWHHVALRVGDGRITLLLDGVASGEVAAAVPEIAGVLTIAGGSAGTPAVVAELDELQVSNVARSDAWLALAARSQGMAANLVTFGGDAQKEGGHGSYLTTIARNLTVDGWVVIVICGIMLVIAMFIIVMKALYLSRVEAGNRRFLAEFEALRGDTRSLDVSVSTEDREFASASPVMSALTGEGGKYGASSLFALYHVGVQELNKRLNAGSVGARRADVLSPQTIEAIRASLDASGTRLQQQLSSAMVMLTIAISGGPFLGLLGTVVGVMITFAAIAAAGDVNVNAIAPGVAAALAATVAGLAVAIPALFGYNWLNTRIKSIAADNRVFADEFVARIAEQYS